jgi:hypothetical protein
MATTLLPETTAARRGLSHEARRELLYFLGVPVVLGLLFGWIRASRTADWPLWASVFYWIGICFIDWMLCDLGTRVAARGLRAWKPPLWAVLAAGAALVQWPIFALNTAFVGAYQSLLLAPDLHTTIPDLTWGSVVKSLVPGVALWLTVNLALFRLVALPRYGFRPAARDSGDARGSASAAAVPATGRPRPGFLARLPEKIGGAALYAISAEEHYLRVITAAGSALVLYRMSDAVRELEASSDSGLQVHRSWWVAKDAIERVEKRSGNVQLVLKDGTRVPVSRSYRKTAEERGYC